MTFELLCACVEDVGRFYFINLPKAKLRLFNIMYLVILYWFYIVVSYSIVLISKFINYSCCKIWSYDLINDYIDNVFNNFVSKKINEMKQ